MGINSKILIVEGKSDKFAIASLIKAKGITWPENESVEESDYPVWIEASNGRDNILEPGYLASEIVRAARQAIGVVLDADEDASQSYDSIHNRLRALFPEMPRYMPSEGLSIENDGKRFGLWIMPDNQSSGKLETFLQLLIPEPSDPLWLHARASTSTALQLNAECRHTDIEKAELHTRLAWTNPPGISISTAITKKILDTASPYATPFVNWFRKLYDL